MKTILGVSEKYFVIRSFLIVGLLLTSFTCIQDAASISKDGHKTFLQRKLPVSKEICQTEGCIETAKTFLDNMNPSVSPCDDFYQFACGNFIKKAVFPPGETVFSSVNIIDRRISEQLKNILVGTINPSEPRSLKKLQAYYAVCMNTQQRNERSENDLKDILSNLGGWPVLEGKAWNEEKFDWKNITYALRKMGYSYSYLIDLSVIIDPEKSNKNILLISQARTTIDQESLTEGFDDPIVQAYLKLMVDVAVLLGANRKEAEKELSESLQFEIELAKISLSTSELDGTPYTAMTIEELQSTYKDIPWLEYLNNFLVIDTPLEANSEVLVEAEYYLENIGKLLKRTRKKVIANYMFWGTVSDSLDKLSERLQEVSSKFDLVFMGKSSREELWQSCLRGMNTNMEIALGAVYVRRYFDEISKQEVKAMLKNMRSTYQRTIEQLDWMDDDTKKAALKKLKAIVELVGYSNELFDNEKVDKLLENIEINTKSYLKTQLSIDISDTTKYHQNLQKPVNKTDWILNGAPTVIDASYYETDNSIKIHAGILQGLFFSKDRPKYLNYGGIGILIGHEITHGFDNEGSNYDLFGNMVNWWQPESKVNFEKRAQCFVEQYNNFTVKELNMNLNGKLGESENIADNGGYKKAYYAYIDWLEINGPEPNLPGLSFTERQLFWLSSANMLCAKYTPETLERIIKTNEHSPSEFRVNGPLQNRPEFAQDFNCPLNSPMNPVNKCSVW